GHRRNAGIRRGNALEQLNNGRIRGCRSLRDAGHGRLACCADVAKDGSLITGKEKCAVTDDRTAEGAAELVAMKRVCGTRRIPRFGIEHGIAHKLEGIAVKAVAARSGYDVDYSPGILAVLRAVVAGLHAEFLKRIGHWKGLVYVGVFVNVVSTVELVADLILAGAIRGNRHRSREGLGRPLVGATAGRSDRTRHE